MSFDKAKVVGKMTKTDPIIWIDPSKVNERNVAWLVSFPRRKKR